MTKIGDAAAGRLELLIAARKVADFANSDGLQKSQARVRAHYRHLGALLADSILQAGLNYSTVVRPRIERILATYPYATTTETLLEIVNSGEVGSFLNWKHPTKIDRFIRLVGTLADLGVEGIDDLRTSLRSGDFSERLRQLNGIGPKTIDYMSCLAGDESIPVDRHIRAFALRAGVEGDDYYYLKNTFCFAADLLSVSRREFDAWIWQRESSRNIRNDQLGFYFCA
ncbi:hypothetical protein [Pleomorphomonas oryzae]|uniref:hypothetical protein n=1 Tax=Pleomorphomonas oryzae TaxID=261934 RepID=UPI00056A8695|nr:hypothetical protein [Pleomorphomonas oryzae]